MMPYPPLNHRPQTLREAKRAYRKSGGTVRLSESEKAILERRAVLQERADRIKEREARRKSNLKKREERIQKEREARHRMGIATPPTKEGIPVGPSQLHLSGFVYAGAKRKMGDITEGQGSGLVIQKQGAQVPQERQDCTGERSPQSFCANPNPHWLEQSQLAHAASPKVQDFTLQDNRTLSKRSSSPRLPLQDICANTNTTVFKKPTLLQHQPGHEAISDDGFDDFFASNTQIERELSPPSTPPSKNTSHAITTTYPPVPTLQQPPASLLPKPPTSNEDATKLLTFLSTQDLDFTEELTQIVPLPAAFHDVPHKTSINEKVEEEEDEEGEEEFPDDELENIVLQIPLEPPPPITSPDAKDPPQPRGQTNDRRGGNSSHSNPHALPKKPALQIPSHYPKTKEFHHQPEAPPPPLQGPTSEWDAFDLISTQDLISLDCS